MYELNEEYYLVGTDPLQRRRTKLEEALRFHNFNFEIDNELQWIRDREPAARSETLGQDLHTAQTLDKKHKKLEAELTAHQPAIDNSLANGHALIEQNHPQKDKVTHFSNRVDVLNNQWGDYLSKKP